MKTNYNKEDLFHSLPDYISDHIEDKDLLIEIEKEIEINPEFKNEYENMKHTFSFLNSAELEAPAENYFNNLPVRINEKLYGGSGVSAWEKIGLLWKILIPAVSMIIIAILLYNYSKSGQPEYKLANNGNTKIETNEKIKVEETNKTDLTQKETKEITDKENTEIKNVSKSNLPKEKVRRTTNRSLTEPNNFETTTNNKPREKVIGDFPALANSIAENVDDNAGIDEEDDILYINDSEYDEYEDEFLELTPEEQHEILENLNKSQI